MASKVGRVLAVALLFVCASATADDTKYRVPDVELHAFQPKGFRAMIPDSKDIAYFVFQGLLKKKGESNKIDVTGETGIKIHIGDIDYWVVDLPDLELEVGDTIDYLAFVAFDNAGYVKDNLRFEVKSLEKYDPLPEQAHPTNETDAVSSTTPAPETVTSA